MRKLVSILFLMLFLAAGYAQNVNLTLAQKVAANYYAAMNPGSTAKSDVTLCMSPATGSDTLFYVFNFGSEGFVIVSGEQSVLPVLAYSDEGSFKPGDQAPALVDWLKAYTDEIAYLKSQPARQADPAWAKMTDHDYLSNLKSKSKGVSPLITSKWDQMDGYNYKCPAHPAGPGGHCVTGCVATALAMVLKYYNYPVHGIGSHSYPHPFYGTISADFANTTYDYASMTATVNTGSREAISTLIFHCGVAVNMYYTPTESGSDNYMAYLALKQFFNYKPSVSFVSKAGYTLAEWKILLRDNLDQMMPVLYSGSGSSGGHAFICDGYTDTTKFHFNWGWSGSNNGYYTISSLAPGGMDFSNGQDAILGISPYFAPYCATGRTLTDYTKTFNDGSGSSYYWNNTGCDWLIKPPAAQKVLLMFSDFQLEDGKDFVSVYDGTSTAAPLLGTFTGHNYPPALTANSGKMFITFTSDGQNQDMGWTATYTSVLAGIDGNADANSIALWPVPAKDELNLMLSSALNGSITISVFDVAGKLIKTVNAIANAGNTVNIDVSDLASGTYILEASCNDTKIYKKFVK